MVLVDPDLASRWLVKRIAEVRDGPGTDRPLRLFVLSDNVESGRDSRRFGAVGAGRLIGKVYYRYGPTSRRSEL